MSTTCLASWWDSANSSEVFRDTDSLGGGFSNLLLGYGKLFAYYAVAIAFVAAGKAFLVDHDAKKALIRLSSGTAIYLLLETLF